MIFIRYWSSVTLYYSLPRIFFLNHYIWLNYFIKKILLILLFIPIIFSCNNIHLTTPKYQSTSVINNQIEIGVTLDDFLLIAGERAEKTAA